MTGNTGTGLGAATTGEAWAFAPGGALFPATFAWCCLGGGGGVGVGLGLGARLKIDGKAVCVRIMPRAANPLIKTKTTAISITPAIITAGKRLEERPEKAAVIERSNGYADCGRLTCGERKYSAFWR